MSSTSATTRIPLDRTQTRTSGAPIARLTLDPSRVTRFLVTLAILVIFASTVVLIATSMRGTSPHDVRLAQLFYVDGERNIPTAFSASLLLLAGMLLAAIATLERRGTGRLPVYWLVLCLGFLFMGVDEAWSFHEKLTATLRARLGTNLGIFYHAWVLPALGLLVALGVFFFRFLLRLPRATRVAFLVAAAVYLGGAVGIEMVEGVWDEVHGDRNLTSGLIATTQEALEMGGVILFIRALLQYLGATYDEVQVRFDRGARAL